MCMLPEKCEECFDHITTSINEKADKFFEDHQIKFDQFLEKSDRRENIKLVSNSIIMSIFGVALLYMFSTQSSYTSSLEKKAEKTDFEKCLTIKAAREVNDIRDAYYRQLFVVTPKDKQTVDSTNYYWIIKHYLGESVRGAKEIKNLN